MLNYEMQCMKTILCSDSTCCQLVWLKSEHFLKSS